MYEFVICFVPKKYSKSDFISSGTLVNFVREAILKSSPKCFHVSRAITRSHGYLHKLGHHALSQWASV